MEAALVAAGTTTVSGNSNKNSNKATVTKLTKIAIKQQNSSNNCSNSSSSKSGNSSRKSSNKCRNSQLQKQ